VAEEQANRASIQVIDRMMNLLDALAAHPGPATLKLLAHQTQLHPSTAHRILNVMVRNRLVDRIEPGTYCLGMRLMEFGALVQARMAPIDPTTGRAGTGSN
jgi:DNA-binding IclR family transcriptional regulator